MNIRGKEISAREVEHAFGLDQGGEERFASMCNAIAWAECGRRAKSLPSFTERVKVGDYGIDAEWSVDVTDDEHDHPMLGRGWNVYQYKMRDLSTNSRASLINGLVTDLKGKRKKPAALVDLYTRTGRRPDRYVLFTNLDLRHPTAKEGEKGQKAKLKDAILLGYDDAEGVQVEILGAAELAASLNGLPHVRAAYFGGPRFSTAQEELIRHEKVWGLPERIPLVGRDAEVNRIRNFLVDREARAMFVSAPQDMGKTRIVLEVTSAERPVDTVVALRASDLRRDDLAALRSTGSEVVVVAEDPGVAVAEALLEEALGGDGLKLIITLPTAEGEPVPGYVRSDVRTRYMKLEPLGDEDARKLLEGAGADLGYGVERWVIERAGGNPGFILAAAEAGSDLQRGGVFSLAQQVARGFESRVRRELGDDALQALEVLSVLSLIGVRGDAKREIATVVAGLGDGPTVNGVLKLVERLEDAGLVRARGDYVEVMPPFLANHLAAQAFLGREGAPAALLSTLDKSGRDRLLERLSNIRGEESTRFWNGLFRPGGPLHDLSSTLENLHLLVPAAAAMPEMTAQLLEKSLSELDVETRHKIVGDARRQLIYAMQELLAKQKTAEAALHCLLLLAEAENERFGDNAMSVFSESFRPMHPLVAMSPQRRLRFLRETILEGNGHRDTRKVAITAAAEGLSMRGMALYQGGGAEPLEGLTPETHGELWDYAEGLTDLLMEATRSGTQPLAEVAGNVLPQAIADLLWQAPVEKAVERMEKIVKWALGHEAPVSVPELAERLRRVQRLLDGWIKAGEADNNSKARERSRKLLACVERVERLQEALDKGDFRTRLERWAGQWTGGGIEMVPDGSGGMIFRFAFELRELAKEAVKNTEKLTEELLLWTIYSSDAQKRRPFFRALGEYDAARVWQQRLELAGAEVGGEYAFAGYFGGYGKQDSHLASERLDELAATGAVTSDALLMATAELGDSEAGVARVEETIRDREVMPTTIVAVLIEEWVQGLSDVQLARLLSALAGPNCENASAVVRGAGYWKDDFVKNLRIEAAAVLWWCLGHAATDSLNNGYSVDRLASLLSRPYPNSGFILMEWLLRRPFNFGDWTPVSYDSENLFWKALCESDRERAYRLLISLAQENSSLTGYVAGGFKGVIDQERDGDLLLTIAKEGRSKAELVAKMLSGAKSGFWPIAIGIAEAFPLDIAQNERLRGEIEIAVFEPEFLIRPQGRELANLLEARRKEIEGLLGDDATPETTRRWLKDLAEHLRGAFEQTLMSEASEEAETFRTGTLMDPKNSEEAKQIYFALRRLVESSRFDLVQQLLSRDELLRLLPKLKFSEQDEEQFRLDIERGG
jgi:hypothetical protein